MSIHLYMRLQLHMCETLVIAADAPLDVYIRGCDAGLSHTEM